MCPETFVYSSLDKTRKNIRLLQINPPESDSDPITCSLSTFTVDDKCPPFIALSYAWGENQSEHEILVNGRAFRVRPNLWSALHQLPNSTEDIGVSYFWIDAICINQNDNSERNHQVAMMKSIYQSATAVFAWLGPAFPDSNLAIEAIRQLHPKVNHSVSNEMEISYHEALDRKLDEALTKLFHNAYFRRLWVVQEFVLAKDLWIICGTQMCNWTQFQQTFYWGSQTLSAKDLIRVRTRNQSMQFPRSFAPYKATSPPGLLYLINIFMSRECSEVRDRIYGLLGIIPQCPIHLANFQIDYEISTEKLFYHTVSWLRAANPWRWNNSIRGYNLWSHDSPMNDNFYDKLGTELQLDEKRVRAQKVIDRVVAIVRYLATLSRSFPESSKLGGLPWPMAHLRKKVQELLNHTEIEVNGLVQVNKTFEDLMQNPDISGGFDEPAGWRAYEPEIKAALRLMNGETWEEIDFVLYEERPPGCCC